MGGDSESNLEMRCSADEAWYDGSLSFAPGSKDAIVVHFNDFDNEEDERFPTSDLLDPKKLRSRVRVRSEQLQDWQCKLVNEGQSICGCLDDGEDRKYYDAKVVSIVEKRHSFSDDGEECKCDFKLLWNDGPKKGRQTLVGCAEVCFLSNDNPEEDPMVKNLVKKLAGSGEQRRKLAAPKRLSTKDLPSPMPRAPSPTPDVPPSKKQASKEPTTPSLEHPPSKKQPSKEPSPPSPEPAALKKQLSSKDHSPSTLPNHRVQLGQQASAKSQGSKKKRIMQAKIMEQPDLASDNDALNNLDLDARPVNTPKDRSHEGSEDAPGHGNESEDVERSGGGGGGEGTKKGSVGRRRLVKAKVSKAVVAPAPEVVLREEETPVRAIEKSLSFKEKVKLNTKKAATEDSAARDEATAIREEEDIRRPVKKRVKSNPKKPTSPEVTAPREEAAVVAEDDDVTRRRPIKMRVKFNTSKKANANVAAAPKEAAAVREDDVLRSSLKEGEKSSTMKKATPDVPAVPDETVSLTLGERVKLKSLEKSLEKSLKLKSVETSPQKKSELTEKKKKAEAALQKKAEVSPQKKAQVSPQKKAQVGPQKKAQVGPQKKAQVGPQKKAQVGPQKKLEVSPQKKPEVTPQKKPEDTPQKKPEDTPQKKPEDTPQKKPEDTPQKKPEDSPQKKPEDSPQKKRKAAHKTSLEKVGIQIVGKQMQKQVLLESRLRSKPDEATRPEAPSKSKDVAAPAPKEQQKRKPGRPRKHPIPKPVSESLASKEQIVLGLSEGQRQGSQQEEIIDAAIVEKETSDPANKKTTKSKRPREELQTVMPDAEDICSDKSTQEEDETRDEPQCITTRAHNSKDRKIRGTTDRERQQPQNDDALSDKSTDDDEDHTPLVKKTKRTRQSSQIDLDKTTKSHTDNGEDHTPAPQVGVNAQRLGKKSIADVYNGIVEKYHSNRTQVREPNVEKTTEAQEAMTPGSSEELTGSPPRASNQVQETVRISDLRKPETPATEVIASGKRRRRHVVVSDDEEDEVEVVAKKSKNGKEHLHGSVDSSANGQDDCNDPKTTSTSALDEEVVIQDGGKKASTSRLLLISNMETNVSAHDALQLLQEHTEGACAVHVLPVGDLQSAAVGYALYRDNESALKAFEHLTAPARFVVSPSGRPWIISQSTDVYGPHLCGFAARTAFKSDAPGVCGIISDQPPVQELLMVTKEKDSKAYSQALSRSKAYAEHQKWRKELFDRVVKDEMKV